MGGTHRVGVPLLLAWVLSAACGGGVPDQDVGPGAATDSSGSVAVPADAEERVPPDAASGADTVVDDPLAGLDDVRSRLPQGLLVRKGACPFECCTYRDWTSTSAIPLYAAERDRSRVVDTIPAGATFRALGGNVHVVGLELVIMTDTLRTWTSAIDEWSTTPSGEREFLPGDTVVVLDYVGEGAYNVWHDGEVRLVDYFWWEREDGSAPARVMGEHETAWWVRAETRDGVVGWIDMEETPRVRGADACS